MLLFTWNLKQRERAFRLAIAHLASAGDRFVAAFQELPLTATSTAAAQKAVVELTGEGVRCLGVVGSTTRPGRVGLFCSGALWATRPVAADPRDRMAMATIRGNRWSGLNVIGFHAVDRRNASSDYARVTYGMLARQDIEGFWARNRPLIVMGDFNADPYDPEVSSRIGLFAVRDAGDVRDDWVSPLVGSGGRMRLLYNPTWHLLPESTTRPGGTFLLNSTDRTSLLTRDQSPRSSDISDHLPLQLRIKIG